MMGFRKTGSAPFGKPFKYTETLKFTSEKKWWKFWGKNKVPAAWITVEGEDDQAQGRRIGQAWMMKAEDGSVRISPIEPGGLVVPLYDREFAEDVAIAFGEEPNDHTNS